MRETPGYEPTVEKTSWKQRILNMLAEVPYVDNILRERAVDIIQKSKISEYLKPGGRYMDLGSGLGHIVEEIVRHDGKETKFIAAEPTWKPLGRVRRRATKVKDVQGDERALFAKAVGEHLPIRDKSLDGVSIFFVTHHVSPENQARVFKEVKRVLKDDGYLFLIEDTPPDDDAKQRNEIWDRRLNFEPADEPHYYKSDAEWRAYFEAEGWEVIDSSSFQDVSPKKNEGVIQHGSYILRRRQEQHV